MRGGWPVISASAIYSVTRIRSPLFFILPFFLAIRLCTAGLPTQALNATFTEATAEYSSYAPQELLSTPHIVLNIDETLPSLDHFVFDYFNDIQEGACARNPSSAQSSFSSNSARQQRCHSFCSLLDDYSGESHAISDVPPVNSFPEAGSALERSDSTGYITGGQSFSDYSEANRCSPSDSTYVDLLSQVYLASSTPTNQIDVIILDSGAESADNSVTHCGRPLTSTSTKRLVHKRDHHRDSESLQSPASLSSDIQQPPSADEFNKQIRRLLKELPVHFKDILEFKSEEESKDTKTPKNSNIYTDTVAETRLILQKTFQMHLDEVNACNFDEYVDQVGALKCLAEHAVVKKVVLLLLLPEALLPQPSASLMVATWPACNIALAGTYALYFNRLDIFIKRLGPVMATTNYSIFSVAEDVCRACSSVDEAMHASIISGLNDLYNRNEGEAWWWGWALYMRLCRTDINSYFQIIDEMKAADTEAPAPIDVDDDALPTILGYEESFIKEQASSMLDIIISSCIGSGSDNSDGNSEPDDEACAPGRRPHMRVVSSVIPQKLWLQYVDAAIADHKARYHQAVATCFPPSKSRYRALPDPGAFNEVSLHQHLANKASTELAPVVDMYIEDAACILGILAEHTPAEHAYATLNHLIRRTNEEKTHSTALSIYACYLMCLHTRFQFLAKIFVAFLPRLTASEITELLGNKIFYIDSTLALILPAIPKNVLAALPQALAAQLLEAFPTVSVRVDKATGIRNYKVSNKFPAPLGIYDTLLLLAHRHAPALLYASYGSSSRAITLDESSAIRPILQSAATPLDVCQVYMHFLKNNTIITSLEWQNITCTAIPGRMFRFYDYDVLHAPRCRLLFLAIMNNPNYRRWLDSQPAADNSAAAGKIPAAQAPSLPQNSGSSGATAESIDTAAEQALPLTDDFLYCNVTEIWLSQVLCLAGHAYYGSQAQISPTAICFTSLPSFERRLVSMAALGSTPALQKGVHDMLQRVGLILDKLVSGLSRNYPAWTSTSATAMHGAVKRQANGSIKEHAASVQHPLPPFSPEDLEYNIPPSLEDIRAAVSFFKTLRTLSNRVRFAVTVH